jgi:hypothetical protein
VILSKRLEMPNNPAKISAAAARRAAVLLSGKPICRSVHPFCPPESDFSAGALIWKEKLLPQIARMDADSELERFHKCCSAAPMAMRKAVFLIFGVVSAQSQGYSNLLLRRSLARKSKILAALRYIFSVNALNRREGR